MLYRIIYKSGVVGCPRDWNSTLRAIRMICRVGAAERIARVEHA